MRWAVYEQALYDDDLPPKGDDWQPIGCYGTVEHDGERESLGGGYVQRGVLVWVRQVLVADAGETAP